MEYTQWKLKIADLPDSIKNKIRESVNEKRPVEFCGPDDLIAAGSFDMTLDKFVATIKSKYEAATGRAWPKPVINQIWYNRFDDAISEIASDGDVYSLLGIKNPDRLCYEPAFHFMRLVKESRPELLEPELDAEGHEVRTPWHEKFKNAANANLSDGRNLDTTARAIWEVAGVMTRLPRIDKRLWSDYPALNNGFPTPCGGHPLLINSPLWDELPPEWPFEQDDPDYWIALGYSRVDADRAARHVKNGEPFIIFHGKNKTTASA